MTTSRETVPNRALSGIELKSLIRADMEHLLDNEGLLSDYIGYGRVAYDVTLRLHLDNPLHSESSIEIASKSAASNAIAATPALASVEPPPLPAPSERATMVSNTRSRKVTSPNAERIRTGLPVPVEVRQQDGTKTTEHIQYPPQPELGEGDVADKAAAINEWKA